MSLVEDLMQEIQSLKQVNSELKAEMERAKENVSTVSRIDRGKDRQKEIDGRTDGIQVTGVIDGQKEERTNGRTDGYGHTDVWMEEEIDEYTD